MAVIMFTHQTEVAEFTFIEHLQKMKSEVSSITIVQVEVSLFVRWDFRKKFVVLPSFKSGNKIMINLRVLTDSFA